MVIDAPRIVVTRAHKRVNTFPGGYNYVIYYDGSYNEMKKLLEWLSQNYAEDQYSLTWSTISVRDEETFASILMVF